MPNSPCTVTGPLQYYRPFGSYGASTAHRARREDTAIWRPRRSLWLLALVAAFGAAAPLAAQIVPAANIELVQPDSVESLPLPAAQSLDPALAAFVNQSKAEAEAKSTGCVACHATVGDPHMSPSVHLGCCDCPRYDQRYTQRRRARRH